MSIKKINEMFFDGACFPFNPGGHCGYGVMIRFADGHPPKLLKGYIGSGEGMTNNLAEWIAMIEGLRACVRLKIKKLHIYGDSQLVINQAAKYWTCKKPHLRKRLIIFDKLKENFDELNIQWIPRELNTVADELSKQAIQEELHKQSANEDSLNEYGVVIKIK